MDPTKPKLAPRQAECLRLVAAGLTSKEIAIELNIGSKHTVDGYIAEAVEHLGARNRREAARIWSDTNPLIGSGDDSARVELTSAPPHVEEATAESRIEGDQGSRAFTLPFPTRKQPRNALSPLATIGWVFAIALLSLMGAALAVSIGNGAGALAVRLAQPSRSTTH